jgi:hypothetical protein
MGMGTDMGMGIEPCVSVHSGGGTHTLTKRSTGSNSEECAAPREAEAAVDEKANAGAGADEGHSSTEFIYTGSRRVDSGSGSFPSTAISTSYENVVGLITTLRLLHIEDEAAGLDPRALATLQARCDPKITSLEVVLR